jgi:multisubunit Na+/H+ antiporter MnhE subunit
VVVGDAQFRRRNAETLREAQNALNVAFGAILSAYVGNSLADIDNRPFDHARLAGFFILIAVFILGLCVSNVMMMRREWALGGFFLVAGLGAAVFAHALGREVGFEVVVLRILTVCWVVALLGSNMLLTLIVWLHHRRG